MKCPNCGLVKPKVIPNVIGYGYLPFRFPFIGFGKVCPKCGFILGALS